MSHLRRRTFASGRVRRAAAAVFAGGVLVSVAQVVAASPSHAACGEDGEPLIYCYSDGDPNPDPAGDIVLERYVYRNFGATGHGLDPQGAVRAATEVAKFDASYEGFSSCTVKSQLVRGPFVNAQGITYYEGEVYVRCRKPVS